MLGKLVKTMLVLSVVTLAACATRPEKIAAVNLPVDKYQALECNVLGAELKTAESKLSAAAAKQNSAANTDAWFLILSIVPVSKVTGDHAKEVAQFKGEVNAIVAARQQKHCA